MAPKLASIGGVLASHLLLVRLFRGLVGVSKSLGISGFPLPRLAANLRLTANCTKRPAWKPPLFSFWSVPSSWLLLCSRHEHRSLPHSLHEHGSLPRPCLTTSTLSVSPPTCLAGCSRNECSACIRYLSVGASDLGHLCGPSGIADVTLAHAVGRAPSPLHPSGSPPVTRQGYARVPPPWGSGAATFLSDFIEYLFNSFVANIN